MLSDETPGVLRSTAGVIFFGTPHSGSASFTAKGLSMDAMIAFVEEDSEIKLEFMALKALESEGGEQLPVTQDFMDLCRSSNGRHIKIFNFFEQRMSDVGKSIGVPHLKVISVARTEPHH